MVKPRTPIDAGSGKANFERRYLMLGLTIAGDFGLTLALPALAAAWLGLRLAVRYGNRPLWLAACLMGSALISAVMIKRRAKEYGDRYQRLIDEENLARGEMKDKP